MKKIIVLRTISIFILVIGCVTTYSQEGGKTLDSLTLKELLNVKVITASKVSQNLEMAPATVRVITREQIKIRGYQSLLDLLYDMPDIKIDDKIYSGLRNSFTVRGTQGSQMFTILLDGVSISSPSGEAMPIMENYPVNLAKQVEIVYGPASALYGANAVSGVINIITKKPVSRKALIIEASSSGGNYGYTNHSLFLMKKLSDQVYLTLSGQYAFDKGVDYSKLYKDDSLLNVDYPNGGFNTLYGLVKPIKAFRSGYEAPMSAHNIYAVLNAYDFTFSFFKSYSKLPTAFGNNTSNTLYNKEVFMAQNIYVANASYKKTFNKVTSATALIVSEYNMDPNSNYRNLYTAMEPAYKYSTCLMIKMDQQFDYRFSKGLNFSAGLGVEKYNTVPQSTDLIEPVNKKNSIEGTYMGSRSFYHPDGLPAKFYFIRYHNIGSYLQSQYAINSKLNLTIGARFDINSRYGSSLNPRIGIVYTPNEKTTLKVLYGSAFLAPNPTESYAQYGSFETQDSGRTYHSYFMHLPNPGLKPIKSQNAEFSINRYLTDNISVNLNAFYTTLSGLHEFANDNETTRLYNNMFNNIPVDYIEVFVNEEKQNNYGGSVEINWKSSIRNIRLNTFASLSYINGRVIDPILTGTENRKEELDFISPFMFRIGTDLKTEKFSCSPRLILMSRQHIAGIADATGPIGRRQTIPGYALLNVSMRYNMTEKGSVFINLTNALNQRYRSVGFNMDLSRQDTDLFNGQPEDPIRISAGIHIQF